MSAVDIDEARSGRARNRAWTRKSRWSRSSTSASSATSPSPSASAITPTYSGCPATEVIERTIREALDAAGFRDVDIETELSPPWTTDWITDEGKAALKAYGIAPPDLGEGRDLPAMRLDRHRGSQPLRLDPVQGAMALQGLPRAVRPLQMPLGLGASPLGEAAVGQPPHRVAPAVAVLVRLAHRGLVDGDTEARLFRDRQIAVDRRQHVLVDARNSANRGRRYCSGCRG